MFDPIAYALCSGGLPVIEISLETAELAFGGNASQLTFEEARRCEEMSEKLCPVVLNLGGMIMCVAGFSGAGWGGILVGSNDSDGINTIAITVECQTGDGIWLLKMIPFGY